MNWQLNNDHSPNCNSFNFYVGMAKNRNVLILKILVHFLRAIKAINLGKLKEEKPERLELLIKVSSKMVLPEGQGIPTASHPL